MGSSAFFIHICLKGYLLGLSLLGKQFLKLVVQHLAHSTVSHRLIAFDAISQHHDFIYILFHNQLFVLSAFRKAIYTSFSLISMDKNTNYN